MTLLQEWGEYFPIRVTLFGNLQLKTGSCLIDTDFARSEKMSGLLAYLMLHSDRHVSVSDLLDAIWPETESDQPENALKMQVYRARTLFKQSGLPFFRECILATRGCYRWNPEIPCEIDTLVYEKACQTALNAHFPPTQQQELLEHAISLYRGDFLPGCHAQSWVEPLAAYYRQLFRLVVSALIRLFQEQQAFAQITDLCRRLALLDPYWEELHYHLMQSLISQGFSTDAITHYRYLKQLFNDKLGVALSAHIDALYQGLVSTNIHAAAELTLIRQDLQESGQVKGAYVCDYTLFRQIYHLQARIAARSGISTSLILLTMTETDDVSVQNSTLSTAMGHFFVFLQKYLRSTDLLAPYSASQYVLMMPVVSVQNLETALKRIISLYRTTHPKDRVAIEYLIDWVDPPESIDWGDSPPHEKI